MTKQNLKQNLENAIAADFGDDHSAKYNAVKEARRALLDDMHESQKEAVMNIYKAVNSLMFSYHELCHPHYDDIVNLDSALWGLRNAFCIGHPHDD